MYDRLRASIDLVKELALQFGEFTLASGKRPATTSTANRSRSIATGPGSSPRVFSTCLGDRPPQGRRRHGHRRRSHYGRRRHDGRLSAACRSKASWCENNPRITARPQYIEGPVSPGDRRRDRRRRRHHRRFIARGHRPGRSVRAEGHTRHRHHRPHGRSAAAFAARGYTFDSLLTIRDFGIEPPTI